MMLSSADQGDDFQAVALGKPMLGVALARNKFQIDLHRHRLAGQAQFVQQLATVAPSMTCGFGR